MSGIRSLALLMLGLAACLSPLLARAITLSDPEFDLADYQVRVYAAPGQTLTATQDLDDGNPGAALEIRGLLPPPGLSNALSRVLVYSDSMRYDPAVGGVIGSIDWSIDKWTTIVRPAGLGLFNGVTLLAEQTGRYYVNFARLPDVQNAWFTGSATALVAASFVELVDPLNGTVDSTSHPDFAGAPLRFGISAGFGAPAGAPTIEVIGRYDNMLVSISPVPEPAAAVLWLAGVGMMLAARRRS